MHRNLRFALHKTPPVGWLTTVRGAEVLSILLFLQMPAMD